MRQVGTIAMRGAAAAEVVMLAILVLLTLLAGCGGTGGSAIELDPLTATPADLRAHPDAFAAAVDSARVQSRGDLAAPYWPYRLAELSVAVDSLATAQQHLRASLHRDADYAPAVALLSKLQYEQGNHAAAVDLLQGYLARNPAAPAALHAALAVNLEALGAVDEAAAALVDCAADDPAVATARTYVQLRGDQFLDARDNARDALAANPRSAANHNNLGICLLYDGKPAEARRQFETALEIEPALPGALYNLAIVETVYYFDPDAGRQWFERYLQVASDDPDDLASLLAESTALVGSTALAESGGDR